MPRLSQKRRESKASSPGLNDMIIRKAMIKDIKEIHKILGGYAGQGLLLARPLSELYDHLRDFYVADDPRENSGIWGACALEICWEDLAEVRSLAVVESRHRLGVGMRLVEACLGEARGFGLKRVFALTYVPGFFSRLGFNVVDKSTLPHKVWADCLKCPEYPDCDEIAMVLEM